MNPTPSIYENFNARNLSAVEVAQTFIPSLNFSKLLAKNHTLIVGPRGSGKTTLLKMCQQEALDAWEHDEAETFRTKVDFVGVYVPTDVSWGRQIQSLGEDRLDPEDREVFAIAAFSTNVLRTLAETMEYRAMHKPKGRKGAKSLSEKDEANLVREICENWLLPPRFSTFQSLKHQLSRRLNELHTMANQEGKRSAKGRQDRLANCAFLHLSFLAASSPAIEMFNDRLGERNQRWALFFDELELAPPAIINTLIESLRSIDERLLFKLSLAPFCKDVKKIEDALAATPGNDYEVIPLWFSHKEDGTPFCHELWKGLLKSANRPYQPPEDVFGTSLLTTSTDEWSESEFATVYRRGTRRAKSMENLAEKDSSFREFLDSNEIDLETLHTLKGDNRAKTVRKAMAIVALRDELLDADGHLRSRKVLKLYSGADSLFAIVEGNPRWFKGIFGEFLQSQPPGKPLKVASDKQTRQIRRAVSRFFALLRTIPLGADSLKSLPELLDKIGKYFLQAQVQDKFTVDPPGRFKVDPGARPGLVKSLGQALNAGAIVSMGKIGDEGARHTILGEEFRLSYLLASHYRLLLRTGRPISLHRILHEVAEQEVPSLFEEIENDAV